MIGGSSRICRGGLVLGATVLFVFGTTGCSTDWSNSSWAKGGATENAAVGEPVAAQQTLDRSIEIHLVNTTGATNFHEVGYGIEEGDWVAEPQEDPVLSPGDRMRVMAEANGPDESVAGYLTLVGGAGADLTVRFRNGPSGPTVEADGSLENASVVKQVRSQDPDHAAFLLSVGS